MTQEEKARAYDEALERARELHGTVFVAAQDLTEQIFPELRESEDERIINAIIGILKNSNAIDINVSQEKMVAWLEKQKEHQNNSDARGKALGRDLTFPQDKDKNLDEIAQDYIDGVKEYNPEPTWDLMQTAVCYGYHYCELKVQQSIQTSEEKEYIRTLKSLVSDFIRDKKPKDVAFYQKIYDWLEGRHMEQKDYRKLYEDIAKSEWFKKAYVGKSLGGDDEQKEQKYIGLSETDKFFLQGVANVLVDNEYKDAAKRLRDLSESLYLQPKGVWSEEDERLIKTTIAFLKDFADTGWENAVECIDWLKYLPMRCLKSSDNGKPSEEQKEADFRRDMAELCKVLNARKEESK